MNNINEKKPRMESLDKRSIYACYDVFDFAEDESVVDVKWDGTWSGFPLEVWYFKTSGDELDPTCYVPMIDDSPEGLAKMKAIVGEWADEHPGFGEAM